MRRTILFVDDEPEGIEPIAILLSAEYEVLTATGAEQALSILERAPVELVIADQRMPQMTGIEFLKRVKLLYPQIPRIILTAYIDHQVMLQAINEGSVYRYVIKPWALQEMRATIRQALEWKDLCTAKGELTAGLIESHQKLAQCHLDARKAIAVLMELERFALVGRLTVDRLVSLSDDSRRLTQSLESLEATGFAPNPLLEEIRTRCGSLTSILNALRLLAQGLREPVALSPTAPDQPAREVIEICRYNTMLQNREVRLAAPPLPLWPLDQTQIRIALCHLLENAARASAPDTPIELEVTLHRGDLVYRVTDQGTGIDSAHCNRIFDPFYSTWGADRAGIGLFICRQVAELHSGELTFRSDPGKGSTFTLRIPPREL